MYSVVRQTSYALLSAFEEDLRRLASDHLATAGPASAFMTEAAYQAAEERYGRDFGGTEPTPGLDVLLQYVDLGELLQLLNKARVHLPAQIGPHVKHWTSKWERLLPIRNRIAHTRPLNYDDFATVKSLTDDVLRDGNLPWLNLKDTKARLEADPGYVLGIALPSPEEDPDNFRHNLPLPDFEDTGFLGRVQQRADLLKLCFGPYPVVSVVGDGGLGKTALALATAYDIVEHSQNPFDSVVWVTAKATRLTPNEIVNIEGAIRDSLGLIQDVATTLIGGPVDDPLHEVLDYLTEFKLLLILDNLETVLDDRLRTFLSKMPSGSKVLITSRIGVGAYEYPLKLGPMDDVEAERLLVALSQIRGVDSLCRTPRATLGSYCRRMFNSPGFIKWFVSAVQTGARPERVLANADVLLDFCVANVYSYLSRDSRLVLAAMLTLAGEHSLAELSFLTELPARDLERILQELLTTNMVTMSAGAKGSTPESCFRLSDLPREYLAKHHPVPPEQQKKVVVARRRLRATQERLKAQMRTNPYAAATISIRTRSDLLVGRYLVEALDLHRRDIQDLANERIDEARRLAPDYFEVYRILGFVRATTGDVFGAREAYDAAVSLEPAHAPLRLFYAGFLLRSLDDLDGALSELEVAERLDPEAAPVQLELARCFLFARQFEAARTRLDRLLSLGALPTWQRRKAFDLHLQWFQRLADQQLVENDYLAAYRTLSDLRSAFEGCAPEILDSLMRVKLTKSVAIARACVMRIDDPEDRREAEELAAWMVENGVPSSGSAVVSVAPANVGEVVGSVKVILRDKGYGFVRSGGSDYFFHRTDMAVPAQWGTLEDGQRVTFSVAETDRTNPRAVGVEVVM